MRGVVLGLWGAVEGEGVAAHAGFGARVRRERDFGDMKVHYAAAMTMLGEMRCNDCKRAPLTSEIVQMMESFGHKLEADDGPKLRWRCLGCIQGKAEASFAVRGKKGTSGT